MSQVVIAGASRTPMGGFQGVFSSLTASDLGGAAIKSALQGAKAQSVDKLPTACGLPSGLGQAQARHAAV